MDPEVFYPDNYKRVLSIGTTSSTNYHFGLAYFNSIKVAVIKYGSGNYFRNTCRICICQVEIQGLQCIVHYISGADDGAFTADTDSQIHNVYAVGMDEYPFVIDRTEDHSGIFHLYAQAVLLKYSDELREAARIDGAGEYRAFAQVMLPLVKADDSGDGDSTVPGCMEQLPGSSGIYLQLEEMDDSSGFEPVCRYRGNTV